MGAMTNTTAAAWKEVGRRLEEARLALRISKREVHRRAGVSDITVRDVLRGEHQVAPGVMMPVNPLDQNLARIAYAVGLDPRPLFELVGREWRPELAEPLEVSSDVRLDALERNVGELRQEVSALRRRFEEAVERQGDGPQVRGGV